MNLATFSYDLPKDKIAQKLADPRDSCKLMIVGKESCEHKTFRDILLYLHEGDVLVVNETKVLHAKLIGTKKTGGAVEIILMRPQGNLNYLARIKGSKPRVGQTLVFMSCTAQITKQDGDQFEVTFNQNPAQEELILVTPPYIKTPIPEKDYQPVFAKTDGSLAAPTASLHFTEALLRAIEKKGVKIVRVLLHIGFGTFLPVRDVATHKTEPEWVEVSKEAADTINRAKRVIAVGTTVVKALETVSKEGRVHAYQGWSDIFIKPGHAWQSPVQCMITNFHLPESSLLMLTCAFGGRERVLRAYREAITHDYTFYSLGDAMFLSRDDTHQ